MYFRFEQLSFGTRIKVQQGLRGANTQFYEAFASSSLLGGTQWLEFRFSHHQAGPGETHRRNSSSGLLPGVTCVDSLRAFLEIDDKCPEEEFVLEIPEIVCAETALEKEADTGQDVGLSEKQELSEEIEIQQFQEPQPIKKLDWRKINETTPKRPISTRSEAASKRRRQFDGDEEQSVAKRGIKEFRSRRQLFSGLECAKNERRPPRGKYGLGNLYSSRFNCPATNAHQAEADVVMLTSLIQDYGMDFLAFAEEQAIPFDQVVSLGTPKKK